MSSSVWEAVRLWIRDSGSVGSFMRPGTSLRKINLVAGRAAARAAAETSALMFMGSPEGSAPSGEITGIAPEASASLTGSGFTVSASPTKPRSTSLPSGAVTGGSLLAVKTVRPEIPTAFTPSLESWVTIPGFTSSSRTERTISTVAASVTRSPPTNWGMSPCSFMRALIALPPPCTRTTRMPTASRKATSTRKRST